MNLSEHASSGLCRLKMLIQSASLDRLSIISRFEPLTAENLSDETKVRGHWMAIALVAGPQLRITFKVHFMSDSGAVLAHKALGLDVQAVPFEKTSDFMREYCNLTLGLLKKELADCGFKSAISLALISRGFDEMFFPENSGIVVARSFWNIRFDVHSVICSAHIELLQSDIDLTKVPTAVSKQESIGDVEFL